MILSMTGFGSGELILNNSHFNFYIKSLNSKNLDISLKWGYDQLHIHFIPKISE